MKNLMMILLSCMLILGLCACGESNTNNATNPLITTGTAEQTSGTTEQTTKQTEETSEATGNADMALAESCINKSVDELYALIGRPESSDYASSCLGDGDDGMLYYDGFIVYTYRENGVETVTYVE